MSLEKISLFRQTLKRQNTARPPVWFMRQAGRYHAHYRALRAQHSFMDLCKKPEIACEVTMGPIRDFDFDAAILFSDLLFPLEVMGMGLDYTPGPALEWKLQSIDDLKRLRGGGSLAQELNYQGEALKLIRKALPTEKGLIGFVGGPLTLFFYAVEGSHQGELRSAHDGLRDGRFLGFCEKLLDLLAENMALQARAGADTIAVLDTCAGEVSPEVYREIVVPSLTELFARFRRLCPDTPITYYSKKTGPAHWDSLRSLPIACLGVDWNHSLPQVLRDYGKQWVIQGNIDPSWMVLPPAELEPKLRQVFDEVAKLPDECLNGWISGLGHGMIPSAREENVHLFLRLQKEYWGQRGTVSPERAKS